MTTIEEQAVRDAIRRLNAADARLAECQTTLANMELLTARNGLQALLDEADDKPDTMAAARRRNAA